jgi:hypothetical protein
MSEAKTTKTKSAGQNNPKTNPSKEGRYKNQDKHRWRKVFVWLIPLPFAVFLTLAFVAQGEGRLWSIILCVLNFFGYALFLLEWYVFKQNPARKRARVVCVVLCLAVVAIGIFWLRKIPRASQSFSVAVEMVFGLGKRNINGDFVLEAGGRCFPAQVGMFIRLISTERSAMIRTFGVEAQNGKKEWVKLTRPFLPFGFEEWYWTGRGLKNAMKWSTQRLDSEILNKSFPAHEPVRGWMFFEVPEDLDIGKGSPLRFHIEDYEGADTTVVIRAEEGNEMGNKDSLQVIPLTGSPGDVDLSGCKFQYFSEEFSEHSK